MKGGKNIGNISLWIYKQINIFENWKDVSCVLIKVNDELMTILLKLMCNGIFIRIEEIGRNWLHKRTPNQERYL